MIDDRMRTFLVTGATGAIGKAIAHQLAQDPQHRVVLAARNETKARAAASDIQQRTGNDQVSYEIVDLSRQAEIDGLAARWNGPLHVLVNNAGITPRQRQITPEGIELQWATNVLGYFWMTRALTPILQHSAPARVVNVASYWAGDLDLTDPEFKRRSYSNGSAYRQSKQANRMLTVAFAERLASTGIVVNACHPGDVSSALSNNLGFGGHQSAAEAAETPVWLAADPAGQDVTGHYFEQGRPVTCRFAGNDEAIERLYQLCLTY
jgi:NAD(P)-dependent dehydrogenase (short-subunit alcohol dehydrogenase family)